MTQEITEEQVRAAFAEACPGVRVDAVAPLTKGHASSHWRFDTDEGPLLLKLPVRNTDPEHLRHLVVATRTAAEAGLPVVRFRAFVPKARALEIPMLVVEYVPADQASEVWSSLPLDDRTRVAEELGDLVGRLHTTRSDALTDVLGARAASSVADEARNSLSEAVRAAGSVSVPGGWDEVRRRVSARFDRIEDVRPALVHHDLYLDNVLIADGRVAVVLDFEHARFSDQFAEFGKISELLFDWYPETREPFLAGYQRWHDLDDAAYARIHAHCGLYNVVMCGYFAQWQPSLVPEYVARIETWLREDERYD